MSYWGPRLVAGGLSVLLAGACTSFGSDSGPPANSIDGGGNPLDAASDESRPVQGGPPIRFSASLPTKILAGETAQLNVIVDRTGDAFGGPIRIELEPTAGISASPIEVPTGGVTGSTLAKVDTARRHGRVTLILKATSPDVPSTGQATSTILVRGSAGAIDTGFGNGGVFTLGQASDASGLVVDAAGRTLVGGRIGSDAAVVALHEDGTIDASYIAVQKSPTERP